MTVAQAQAASAVSTVRIICGDWSLFTFSLYPPPISHVMFVIPQVTEQPQPDVNLEVQPLKVCKCILDKECMAIHFGL